MTADAVPEADTERRNVFADVGVGIRSGTGGRNTVGVAVVYAQAGNVVLVGVVDGVLGTRMEMVGMKTQAGADGASKSKSKSRFLVVDDARQ
jgi:hypothetical protein